MPEEAKRRMRMPLLELREKPKGDVCETFALGSLVVVPAHGKQGNSGCLKTMTFAAMFLCVWVCRYAMYMIRGRGIATARPWQTILLGISLLKSAKLRCVCVCVCVLGVDEPQVSFSAELHWAGSHSNSVGSGRHVRSFGPSPSLCCASQCNEKRSGNCVLTRTSWLDGFPMQLASGSSGGRLI